MAGADGGARGRRRIVIWDAGQYIYAAPVLLSGDEDPEAEKRPLRFVLRLNPQP